MYNYVENGNHVDNRFPCNIHLKADVIFFLAFSDFQYIGALNISPTQYIPYSHKENSFHLPSDLRCYFAVKGY